MSPNWNIQSHCLPHLHNSPLGILFQPQTRHAPREKLFFNSFPLSPIACRKFPTFCLGLFKKAASGVLGPLSSSRTPCTLRAPKPLRPCWTAFLNSPSPFRVLGHVSRTVCNPEIFNYSTDPVLDSISWRP